MKTEIEERMYKAVDRIQDFYDGDTASLPRNDVLALLRDYTNNLLPEDMGISVEMLKTAYKNGFIYEDELPEMTDKDYSEWFKWSFVDGVRIGINLKPLKEKQ